MSRKVRIDIAPPLVDFIEAFGQLKRVGDIVPYAFFSELKVSDDARTAFRLLVKALVLSYIVSYHTPLVKVIDGVEVHRKRFQGTKFKLVYRFFAVFGGIACGQDIAGGRGSGALGGI